MYLGQVADHSFVRSGLSVKYAPGAGAGRPCAPFVVALMNARTLVLSVMTVQVEAPQTFSRVISSFAYTPDGAPSAISPSSANVAVRTRPPACRGPSTTGKYAP